MKLSTVNIIKPFQSIFFISLPKSLLTSRRFIPVFIVISLLGCSKQPNMNAGELEKEFSTAIPVTDMNRSLQIVVDSKESRIKSGSTIGLTIYNKSDHSIQFDNNSSVKLLGSTDNVHWFPVRNAITYSDNMSLSPQGTPLLDLYDTWVRPILDITAVTTEKSEVFVRIVVVGEIMENDKRTGNQVGGYVDMALQP